MKKLMIALTGCVALSACGGGGGTGPVEPEEKPRVVSATQSYVGLDEGELRLNANGDKIIVNVDGITDRLDVGTARQVGTFVGGYSQDGTDYLYAHVSETDGSRSGIILNRDGSRVETSAQFGRLGKTELPTEGSATLTGDYVGYQNYENTTNAWAVRGDASISANFGNETVSGEITNRRISTLNRNTPYSGFTIADVNLATSDLGKNGGFSGDVSGGAIRNSNGTFDAGTGTYKGLIAGEKSGEAVGAVTLGFSYNGRAITETGAFATGH